MIMRHCALFGRYVQCYIARLANGQTAAPSDCCTHVVVRCSLDKALLSHRNDDKSSLFGNSGIQSESSVVEIMRGMDVSTHGCEVLLLYLTPADAASLRLVSRSWQVRMCREMSWIATAPGSIFPFLSVWGAHHSTPTWSQPLVSPDRIAC